MATAIPGTQTSPFISNPPQTISKNISALQKSVSAISGAFITSLLVTPLDVVRVRLQSQQPISIRAVANESIPSRLGYPTLGPDSRSGVTACCREVFFSRSWNTNGSAVQCTYVPFETPAVENVYCAAEETGKRSFRGTWEGLVKIARYEGITSLWRGLSPTLYFPIYFESNAIELWRFQLM
jgi:solute carrier family 25, member 39/40